MQHYQKNIFHYFNTTEGLVLIIKKAQQELSFF